MNFTCNLNNNFKYNFCGWVKKKIKVDIDNIENALLVSTLIFLSHFL